MAAAPPAAARGARSSGGARAPAAAARRRAAVAALVPAAALLVSAHAPGRGRPGCGEGPGGAAGPPCAFARWHAYPTGKYKLLDFFQRNVDTFSDEVLEQMTDLLRVAFAEDIEKWGRRRNWQKALASFNELQAISVEPDEVCWSEAIRACTDKVGKQQWHRGLQLLAEMQERGPDPTIDCYQWAMHGCQKAGEPERVYELLQAIRDHPVMQPDKHCIHLAQKAAGKAADWQMALSLLAEIRGLSGVQLRKVYFAEAFRACELAGEYDWVDWLEDEAAEEGFELTVLPNSLMD